MTFALSDAQWEQIARILLREAGRLPYEGDRFELNLILNAFVELRPMVGKNLPTPTRYRKAWEAVGDAAGQLERAINELHAVGAADFEVTGPHADTFRFMLSALIQDAEYFADIEGRGPKASNRADPLRDSTIKCLLGFWHARGGGLGISKPSPTSSCGEPYGPLIRFLDVAMTAATDATGDEKLSAFSLAGAVEKLR